MYVCMYVCTYVRMYVCMYVCMYIYIYICVLKLVGSLGFRVFCVSKPTCLQRTSNLTVPSEGEGKGTNPKSDTA